MATAIINGVMVIGTAQEIDEFIRIATSTVVSTSTTQVQL